MPKLNNEANFILTLQTLQNNSRLNVYRAATIYRLSNAILYIVYPLGNPNLPYTIYRLN